MSTSISQPEGNPTMPRLNPPPELCAAGRDGHPDADPKHGVGHEGADPAGGLPHQRDHDPHGPLEGDGTGAKFNRKKVVSVLA